LPLATVEIVKEKDLSLEKTNFFLILSILFKYFKFFAHQIKIVKTYNSLTVFS
jgi:hypothetical protein